ncbi:unnamed protein product [Mucor hiemalis]
MVVTSRYCIFHNVDVSKIKSKRLVLEIGQSTVTTLPSEILHTTCYNLVNISTTYKKKEPSILSAVICDDIGADNVDKAVTAVHIDEEVTQFKVGGHTRHSYRE